MPTLADLDVRDLRPELAVNPDSAARRRRRGAVTSLTLHYNGPPVGGAGSPERELRHIVRVDVPNHQARIGADSLMYHAVVLSDGTIHQTRDFDLIAWHCRNREGNEHSLAIHLPVGGAQKPTRRQWDATVALCEALLADHGIGGRQAVKGHLEWAATDCPGPVLMERLRAWRGGRPSAAAGGFYRIRRTVGSALVRTGPGRSFAIALDGQARMWPGDLLDADRVDIGEAVGGEKRWLHRRDGLGWVHWSLVTAVR